MHSKTKQRRKALFSTNKLLSLSVELLALNRFSSGLNIIWHYDLALLVGSFEKLTMRFYSSCLFRLLINYSNRFLLHPVSIRRLRKKTKTELSSPNNHAVRRLVVVQSTAKTRELSKRPLWTLPLIRACVFLQSPQASRRCDWLD
jgi:hypothetical protein